MINKKYIRSAIIILVVLLSVVAIFFNKIITSTKLGLDLQGGIEILYRVDSIESEKLDQDLMESTIDILNKRINAFGISETVIAQEGDNMIRIQVPGEKDQTSARERLGSSAVLTFRNTSDQFLMGSDVLNSGQAKLTTDSLGNYAVKLSIANSDKMYDVTSNLVSSNDARMVIWLDFEEGVDSFVDENYLCGSEGSRCISAATVQQPLSNEAVITGNFTKQEAETLVGLINSGSLQVELTEEYSTAVGASFGQEALSKSVFAAIIGLSLVMLFMIYKYRFSGVISSLGLIIYTFLVFFIFFVLGGVLTLPGIAALVLGVGMAIDANVITFERIKDEYRKTNDLNEAFIIGNRNSFLTIVDANITTAIIAIILFFLGQSAIKGFATMLLINIFVTFVITVLFTRLILRLFVKSNYFNEKISAFINFKQETIFGKRFKIINYVNKNKMFFTFSTILILIGTIFGQVKGFNVGIDFTSGTSMITNISETEYKSLDVYIDDKYEIVDSNYSNEGIAIFRVADALNEEQLIEFETHIKNEYNSDVMIQKVSPLIGKDLIKNSIVSLLIAALAIVIYITIRFRSSFAIASIVALLHDLLVMLALFALLRFTISGDFIAALLAIIGYSINDTIVLFDRIRANINEEIHSLQPKNKKKRDKIDESKKIIPFDRLKELVNKSVASTIDRSLTTSITTLVPVTALIFLGAREILQFNVALAIGIVFGTYSSICIAAQVWLLFERKGYFYGKSKDGWFSVEDSKEKYLD